MDFEPAKYVLIALGGALSSSCLLMQFVVSTLTEAKALRGTQNEKYVAYGIRITAAIAAYVVVVAIARAFKSSTEQTAAEALILIFSGVATLVFGGTKLKRWKENLAGSRR